MSVWAALAGLLVAGTVRASDPWELWPELDLYQALSPTSRLYLLAGYSKGKESELTSLDITAYLDVVLPPFFWPALLDEDWRRKKYLWIRVGYDHVFQEEDEVKKLPEDRGIFTVFGRGHLPAGLLAEGRARADLRWIGHQYSARYRLRLEVNREFTAWEHPVTPWFNAEAFYDTRYDGWSRQLYQLGVELGLTTHFRLEPYLARQLDRLPEPKGLWAVGLVARWYY